MLRVGLICMVMIGTEFEVRLVTFVHHSRTKFLLILQQQTYSFSMFPIASMLARMENGKIPESACERIRGKLIQLLEEIVAANDTWVRHSPESNELHGSTVKLLAQLECLGEFGGPENDQKEFRHRYLKTMERIDSSLLEHFDTQRDAALFVGHFLLSKGFVDEVSNYLVCGLGQSAFGGVSDEQSAKWHRRIRQNSCSRGNDPDLT